MAKNTYTSIALLVIVVSSSPFLLSRDCPVSIGNNERLKDSLSHGVDMHAKNNEGKDALYIGRRFIKNADRAVVGTKPGGYTDFMGYWCEDYIEYKEAPDKYDEMIAHFVSSGMKLQEIPGMPSLLLKLMRSLDQLSQYSKAIKLIIKNTSDLNIQEDESGKTALMLALGTRKLSSLDVIADMLLQHHTDTSLVDKAGRTALHLAISEGSSIEMIKLLIDYNTPINVQSNDGCTALMDAINWGKLEIVQLLLAKGADVNLVNNNGETALMFAVARGRTDIVSMLLQAGTGISFK